MTTLLIPEMNFTCNASVVGFIVSGRNLSDGLHSRVQIWRMISSQSSGRYYQVGNVLIHDGACVAMQEIVGDTYLCILHNNFRVSVQPGDILGLELPATDSDEILFTDGGPINYIFRHSNQLDSNTNLSLNGSSTVQQLPQIIFNLTSGKKLFCPHFFYNFTIIPIIIVGTVDMGIVKVGMLPFYITFSSLLKWISQSNQWTSDAFTI